MFSRHFIQYLCHLVQRILKPIHKWHWIRFLLRQLIFWRQRLFSPDPSSRTQVYGPQQQFRTPSALQSVGQDSKNRVVLMSCIPVNIISSSSGNVLGPASPSDAPYTVENEDLAQSSSRGPIGDVNQDNAIRIDQTHDPVHWRNPLLQPCAPSAGLGVGPHRNFRSFNSVASYGRASYRRHEGPTSHVRFPHLYDIHSVATLDDSLSVATSDTSLSAATWHTSSPHRVAHPGDRLVTSPQGNNEFGDPTEGFEYPRFAQMTSGDVSRYRKNYFK